MASIPKISLDEVLKGGATIEVPIWSGLGYQDDYNECSEEQVNATATIGVPPGWPEENDPAVWSIIRQNSQGQWDGSDNHGSSIAENG